MTLDDFDHEEAKAGMPSQIKAQLDATAAKFKGYSNHIRLVRPDSCNNELWEDDVPRMRETISIPGVIDEVRGYVIAFSRMATRSVVRYPYLQTHGFDRSKISGTRPEGQTIQRVRIRASHSICLLFGADGAGLRCCHQKEALRTKCSASILQHENQNDIVTPK